MNPDELANTIESLILSVSENFGVKITRVQNELYSVLLTKLKEIDVDEDGRILQTAKNRNVLYDAELIVIDSLSSPQYVNAVNQHLVVIPQINKLSDGYFAGISESFKPNRAFLKSLQTQTFQTIESYLLQDGLKAQIQTPLTQILYQNVNSGGSFSGFLDQVREFIKGNEDLDGRLLSYSRGLLRDTLFNYSRSYQQALTADLGLEWYSYSGGLIDHSREFCIERSGKFFHHSEVEKWASLDWKGKYKGTTESSIFIYCGGYNCTHQLIPVSKIIVPEEDLQRI